MVDERKTGFEVLAVVIVNNIERSIRIRRRIRRISPHHDSTGGTDLPVLSEGVFSTQILL